MLTYRSTPLENGFTPSELLMCTKIRNTLPIVESELRPKIPDYGKLFEKEISQKKKQRKRYDRRYRNLRRLHCGDIVWIVDMKCQGEIVKDCGHRSYKVHTRNGTEIRRNRRHLIPY